MTGAYLDVLTPGNVSWPSSLAGRMGSAAPAALLILGDRESLALPATVLFCSAQTPGKAILRAHDATRKLRDEGKTVISGFHSPIEKECLRILLRGDQPIIICPARAIERMRIPSECREAFEAGRLLFLSPFTESPRRVTRESARRRNELVAALADEAFIAHITPGGEAERIAKMLERWGVPLVSPGLSDVP